jgi:hypothetical protein
MARKPTKKTAKQVETLRHDEASRRNIPTAELQSVLEEAHKSPIQVAYERRNRDLDPQLVWRGKDEQDWSDLVVPAPPLFIQEKIHPKVLIDDLMRAAPRRRRRRPPPHRLRRLAGRPLRRLQRPPDPENATEFYQHDANWTNRMILGDSLQVMASLAEREGLRGQVQCIYLDPPYGIKFNSNFQWSTTSRDVKDGDKEHITREPEQVKAFRDTWRDGIHSYLTFMATDPGDLVLDPTCGSGTTAYVAEQWGRRWITIDTSRVALALARARIMGARYPYYLLADSREGQQKEAEVTRPSRRPRRCTATSARASSTSACRTSRSSRSPTTPRST